MALLEMIQEKSFLGTEFATYLWHRSETANDGALDLGDGTSCEIRFEKDLLLTGPAAGEAQNSALRGESPTLAPEAAAALAAGKKVKRARLRLTTGNVTYEFTLNAENFDWSGLKIEAPPSLPFEESVPLRLAALEEFHALLERLYSAFLNQRLDADAWKSETRRIRKWIARKTAPAEESETTG